MKKRIIWEVFKMLHNWTTLEWKKSNNDNHLLAWSVEKKIFEKNCRIFLANFESVCLTCCIIFQFESSCSPRFIRMKMKEELVAGRDLARWQGITTIWISQHGWCIWTTVINSQWIPAENIEFYFCSFYNEKH